MTSRVGRLTAGLLICLLSAACGLPAEDEPRQADLPRNPLTSRTATTAGTEPPGEVTEVLCLVRDGRLVQTVRRVSAPPSLQHHVEALVAGPTEAERAGGLTTALATTTLKVGVPAGSTEARVEVADNEEGARSDETIAYAQIVCTLTSREDVNSVVFTRDGEALGVPRGDGSLSREPLRIGDYASLLAPA
ncbi:GerMN domain-containing protein [Couchioplanes caeruleus]|uniref:GerMN domain-containing protein n=1 Tax=Couchioplanes caeruleus TaxID=56438 RepID=UPI0020BF55F3|nr:GerMN domain-containing protein [Couchioplanes caeruleus]UQU62651.1 GerMN domain-containing protein [Couchioplanes caeruleus]